jgi:hypothetical protein
MRVIFLALLLILPTAAARAQDRVAIEDFLADPTRWDGEEILIDGFITLEDYSKALFVSEQAYLDADYARSLPIIVPNNLLDVREAFERTWVEIRGTYDGRCARTGMFCSAHPGQGRLVVSELWGTRLPESFVGWRRPIIQGALNEMTEMEGDRADRLMRAFGAVMRDVRARDAESLLNGAPPPERATFEAELADPNGRAQCLLFTGDYPLADTFEQGSPVGAGIEYRSETYLMLPLALGDSEADTHLAAACICYEARCSFRHAPRPEIVVLRNFTDPFVCLPFVEIEGGWWLDTGFFLSASRIADYGGDLGTGFETANNSAAVMFSSPILPYSHLQSTLRRNPRARVVAATGSGGLELPAYQAVDANLTWVIERIDGEARVRRVEDEAQE